MPKLGVNIDHVATVRQARRTIEPDPIWAATLAELAGADGITLHLREDRRHIQDRDLRILSETAQVKINLEMAATEAMTRIACEHRPGQATLVPEKREEITTEGGLDVIAGRDRIARCIEELHATGIVVSLFIDADRRQIDAAAELGVAAVELHTGPYSLATCEESQQAELETIATAGEQARQRGLVLNMGHGLTYRNVGPIARLPRVHELNIGHSIIARAVMVGFERAVRDMKALVAPSGAGGSQSPGITHQP